MKRIILFLLTVHCSLLTLVAQAPQAFNYQAVVRDDAGTIVSDQVVGIKISILQGNVSGTVIYSETHAPTTNSLGLVTLEIGGGTTSDDLSAIDWGADLYFLKVEMDASGGTSYSDMGTTQLLSVPYALFAENATDKNDADADPINEIQDLVLDEDVLTITGNPVATDIDLSAYLDNTDSWVQNGDAIFFNGNIGIGTDAPGGKLEVVGDGTETGDDALFEVKRNDGQTVFAVYPEGVRIYVEESETKGTKGGFAIGGFNPLTKDVTNEYLRVTPDSVRVYVNDDGVKGTKGGFAVGGYSPVTKGITNEYLRVSPDSVRVYVDGNATKGTKGGFAVGGFSPVKGTMQDIMRVTIDSTRIYVADSTAGFGIANVESGARESFLDLTTENYFIGHESGQQLTTGLYNSILGYKSGFSLNEGVGNSFIGYKSGFSNTSGEGNCFMGYESGFSNTIGIKNMFFGYQTGYHNTDGIYNQFFGYKAGFSNTSGGHNVFIGYQSGYHNTTAWTNTFIGGFSGYDNTTGTQNVFLGASSGANNSSGYNNVYVGYSAGNQNTTGHGNVFLGYEAGRNEGGSNKLYIDNTNTSSPLIYGDFNSNYLRFNGNVGISVTPAYTLDINGTLNIRRNGTPALFISGYEAIWCNGTYFSWGYGATYNAFADKVSIGTTNTSGYMLYVYGSAYTTGSWLGSDARFKDDIQEIEQPLEKVLRMKGVNYHWKTEEYRDRNFPEGRHYGVIAQDIEKVLPEIVMETNGEKAVAYTEIIPVLIEAMKEQQKLIEKQQTEIDELKKMVREK